MNQTWTVSPPGSPDVAEAVTVAMDGPYVVLRPGAIVDRASTTAFIDALRGALGTGAIVRIDVTPNTIARRMWCPIDGPIEHLATGTEPKPSEFTFHVVAAGVIGIPASGSWWMIDVGRRRFCRTVAPLDLRFLGDTAWCGVRAVWISDEMISVLTGDGSFVTTGRGHNDDQHDSRCLHAS